MSKFGDDGDDKLLPYYGATQYSPYNTVQPKGDWKACHETHKPLPLSDGFVIYGGSCISPKVKDADVYIGFDGGMPRTPKGYPWNPTVEVFLPIQDRGVPASLGDFQALIEWTIQQIKAGKKVHAGCIGGHGRTGLFFTALVASMMNRKDAGQYVRDNYCQKAVESQQQVDYLVKWFGVDAFKAKDLDKVHSSANIVHKSKHVPTSLLAVNPVKTKGCIFLINKL